MPSRRVILAFCVLVSLAVHLVFWFYAAPRITLVRAHAAVEELRRRYQVRLHETYVDETRVYERSANKLASRPGEIRDLVTGQGESLAFEQGAERPAAPVPDLESRLATDDIARDYALEPDAALLREMDVRIVEIAQDVARRELQVARRVVRPSPIEILTDGEMPALRDLATANDVPPLRLPSSRRGLLARGVPTPDEENEAGQQAQLPPREDVLLPQPAETAPPMPEKQEVIVARGPVVEAIRKARESQYAFIDDLLDIAIDTYQAPGEPLGFFRLRIAPKEAGAMQALPRDVTFVLDASSSISQRKLDLSVRGLIQALESLQPQDNFNVVIFRDTPGFFKGGYVPATSENKAAAAVFLKGLESRGETDVFKALQPVIQSLPRDGGPGIVVLVSDGRPTTGLRDSRQIINGLTADNVRNTVFAFGGGRTVNRYLLDLLAYRNRGASRVIDDIERIDDELPLFLASLREPLLVDLRADYGRIDGANVFPSAIPDFYRGRPVTVYGRYDPASDREFVMRLTGLAGDKRKEVIFRADLGKASTGDSDIARNWAFAKSYHIIGEISRVGEQPELVSELRELSRRYGVRTTYSE